MATGNPFSGLVSEQWYIEEITPGATPLDPVWKRVVSTSGLPALIKDSFQSDVLDGSRENSDVTGGNQQVNGEYGIELAPLLQDDFLEGAISSTWQAGYSAAGLDITVDSALKTYTRAAGDFVADGFEVGELIAFPDLTGLNARGFIATTVTATVITGAYIIHDLTDETVTTEVVTGRKLETGSECKTYSILTVFKGTCGTVEQYQIARGVEFTGFNYESNVNANTAGTFPFIGRSIEFPDTPPAGSTYNADIVSKPFNGVNARIVTDGALSAFVSGITVTNDNEASAQFFLNDVNTSFIERGKATNTFSLAAMMCDTSSLKKFAEGTDSELISMMSNEFGTMSITFTRAFLTTVTADLAGPSSITQSIEGVGQGGKLQSSIIIQQINA